MTMKWVYVKGREFVQQGGNKRGQGKRSVSHQVQVQVCDQEFVGFSQVVRMIINLSRYSSYGIDSRGAMYSYLYLE